MNNKKDRIDVEQEVLEAYQSANPTRREDMFATALELLPFEAVKKIHAKFIKKEDGPEMPIYDERVRS